MTTGYHETQEALTEYTRDLHRALSSLMEELEAVDWYQQRVDVTADQALRDILAHNRDEEIEHAAMVLEWLRRNHPVFDEQLRRYLFTTGSVVAQEEEDGGSADGGGSANGGSLGIGSLKPGAPALRSRGTDRAEDGDDESSA